MTRVDSKYKLATRIDRVRRRQRQTRMKEEKTQEYMHIVSEIGRDKIQT